MKKDPIEELMDEEYSPAQTVLHFFKNSPYNNDLLLRKIKKLNQKLEVNSEIIELENILLKKPSSVSILHLNGLEEAKTFLQIAHKLSSELKSGKHRILLTLEHINENLKAKFSQIRYLEVTPQNLSPLFILSKLERHLKLTQTQNQIEPSFVPLETNNKSVQLVPPLQDIYEDWTLTDTQQIQKILTQWSIHLLGPTPNDGRWLVAGENLWKWIYKEKAGHSYLPGHWFFEGQRPHFKQGFWVFNGPNPKLYFANQDQLLAIKLQCSSKKDSIEIAKNKKISEKFWNKNKITSDPFQSKNKSNIFTPIKESKGILSIFKEASEVKSNADLWLAGSEHPFYGNLHFYDIESKSFSIVMKSKAQTDQLMEQLDRLHESQLFLSVKLKRGQIFFKSELIGRVQTKLTFYSPEKVFEIQRRRNFRYEYLQNQYIPVEFHIKNLEAKKIKGYLKNISSGGCALLLPKEFQLEMQKGKSLENIYFEIRNKKISTSGIIKHTEFFNHNNQRQLLVGVQFDILSPNDIQLLDFYVFEMSRDYFLSWL